MLTFAYPWLAIVAPLPLLVVWLLPPYAERKRAIRVPFFSDATRLSGGMLRSGAAVMRRDWPRTTLLALCWALAVIALMRPQRIEPPLHRDVPTRDLAILVDLSASMEAKDFVDTTGQTVDRLTAVKEVLDDFLSRRAGDRVGVIVFGNAPFVLVPFTTDLKLCRHLLQEMEVGMAGPRTALGDAVGLGITLFQRSTVKNKTMIVLTDGNDTGSNVSPADAARIAKDNGIRIDTIAIGDPKAVGEEKLDEGTLRDMANVTGGGFYRALDRDRLVEIYRQIDAIETRKIETDSFRPKTELFWWPLAALVLLSMAFQATRLGLLALNLARHEPPTVTPRVKGAT